MEETQEQKQRRTDELVQLVMGVGLIAFVPLVGLAVFPLQLAALLIRGLVFEYLGLTALTAYVTLYVGYAARRAEAVDRARVATAFERPAAG